MKNKIVIPAGYMGSGSSAITDLISEIEGFSADNSSFEYVFLHCPNGVFDLEDKLLMGNNYIRSDEAIRSFHACMEDLYDKKAFWPSGYKKKLSEDFLLCCREFTDALACASFEEGFWYYSQNPTRRMIIYSYIRYILLVLTGGKLRLKSAVRYRGMTLAYPTAEEFYAAARDFLGKLFSAMGIREKNLVLDQLLLPHNLFRINRYFDENIRVFVVERDPRDVFVLNKYYWTKQGQEIPYPIDVEQFCAVYRKGRERETPVEDSRIMRVRFEDLIFRYEEMLPAVYEFLGVSGESHTRKKMLFNPDISIHNTQLFAKNEAYKAECDYIAERLGEYIYGFPAGSAPAERPDIIF